MNMETTLLADREHTAIQESLNDVNAEDETRMGLVEPELHQLFIPGSLQHDIYVVDESRQRSGSFKANGMAYAVARYLVDNPSIETFYSGTAGNAGAALAWAALCRGRRAVLYAPRTLEQHPAKKENMERYEGVVNVVESDVVSDAVIESRHAAEVDAFGQLVHPYDDKYAFYGQGLVVRRIARNKSKFDPEKPVVQMLGLGGGSLSATGASTGYEHGWQTHVVKPETYMDPSYEGLAVETPGDRASAILDDSRFVVGTEAVSDADTGRASLAMQREFKRAYEPSGLAGLAAVLRHARNNPEPTTYVTVLSGRNVSRGALNKFVRAALKEQDELGIPAVPNAPSRTERRLLVACGTTALGDF